MKRPGIDRVFKFLADNERPVVIDVGAYVGKTTRLFLEANPHALVHSLEPDPSNLEILKLANAGKENVTCYPIAIGDLNGTIPLYVTNASDEKGTSQSNSLYKRALKDRRIKDDQKAFVRYR